jgi:hypothetical protein
MTRSIISSGTLGHMRIDWHFLDGARKAGLPIRPQAFTAYAISREDRAATPRR